MAANAAYGVIKQCLSNGREVTGLITEVGKFLQAEEELETLHRKKQNDPLANLLGKDISDWEHFQHLEDIRQKRKELESYCRLYAPAGTWDRWVKYQADARIARKQARRAAEKAREKRNELILTVVLIAMSAALLAGGMWWLGLYLGKW